MQARQKMLEVQRAHPELDVRLLFQRTTNKIGRGSKTTYGHWATAHGFTWAEGSAIPDEWLED